MASLGGNIISVDLDFIKAFAGFSAIVIGSLLVSKFIPRQKSNSKKPLNAVTPFLLFFYSCFIKPHRGNKKGTQQDALESFYEKQASAYDATRKILLQGREDMLALVAAQLKTRGKSHSKGAESGRVWVDVGGGTGWNIEAMSALVDIPKFFSAVYLVDFSPSLCHVARQRFQRLGWNNVHVVCKDARKFRLENDGADLVTMSYSLSMIPDYYSVIDSFASLLAPNGVIGVVDFYVQSNADFTFRSYTGGFVGRHVNWFLRTFWRAWFDLDRVGLEASRRDYLEYRFGTVIDANMRNYSLGGIPYYIWVGCHKLPFPSPTPTDPEDIINKIDAVATESSDLSPNRQAPASTHTGMRPRFNGFLVGVQNLSANLPLPAFFYQNHPWRMYYDDQLPKHTQFKDQYIYAFTWEDSRVDQDLLHIGPNDVILAITSAGDNILSYAAQSPARIHAVDLNPAQNHLLELKMAAYTALPYVDFWKLFGEGKHPDFRRLLLTKLSPHLSSRSFQFWLDRVDIFSTTKNSHGLYNTGGSRHAIRLFRWISWAFGCRAEVHKFLAAKTIVEQREIWTNQIRPTLLSTFLCNLVVSQESFLWTALGVPKNQLAMIEADYSSANSIAPGNNKKNTRSNAIWKYMVDTLDPVAYQTHVGVDNPYYYVCMAGSFSSRCHPHYLSEPVHAELSRPGALDNLCIHTDHVDEVIARMERESLTVAVIMDSMDWFDPNATAATVQVTRLNRVLKMGGRVLLRSAAKTPWYIGTFEAYGFSPECIAARAGGACIDRVNMYSSCWICTKVEHLV
ncbi:hypothetical protein FE257_008090 [Aspergillus nanangensis]|uniref:Methyltransferase domain-containing protein n=1 Tax=Aspergillus nanangensis TaxID=2582783 RepID=A0AAD4CLZ0_ASPNN|nr:hypothetical protein FE257_008090 [Aspergillus nanangensis]